MSILNFRYLELVGSSRSSWIRDLVIGGVVVLFIFMEYWSGNSRRRLLRGEDGLMVGVVLCFGWYFGFREIWLGWIGVIFWLFIFLVNFYLIVCFINVCFRVAVGGGVWGSFSLVVFIYWFEDFFFYIICFLRGI